MKNIIGILLILISLVLFYQGATTIQNSGESVDLLGLELSVADDNQKNMGYTYLGIGALVLVAGVFVMRKKA